MQVFLRDRGQGNFKDSFTVAVDIRGDVDLGVRVGDMRKAIMMHLLHAADQNPELYELLPVGEVQPRLVGMDEDAAYLHTMRGLRGENMQFELPVRLDYRNFGPCGAEALKNAISADANLKAAGTGALFNSRSLSIDAFGEDGGKLPDLEITISAREVNRNLFDHDKFTVDPEAEGARYDDAQPAMA